MSWFGDRYQRRDVILIGIRLYNSILSGIMGIGLKIVKTCRARQVRELYRKRPTALASGVYVRDS